MSKASKIEEIRELILNDQRPRVKVFWPDTAYAGRFLYNGISLTRSECMQVPCRLGIFIVRKRIDHGLQN
jgi:hypothetical protein